MFINAQIERRLVDFGSQADPEKQQQTWQKATLLHDSMPWRAADRNEEWIFWFHKMQLNNVDMNDVEHHDHYFNRTDMAMAAAAAATALQTLCFPGTVNLITH